MVYRQGRLTSGASASAFLGASSFLTTAKVQCACSRWQAHLRLTVLLTPGMLQRVLSRLGEEAALACLHTGHTGSDCSGQTCQKTLLCHTQTWAERRLLTHLYQVSIQQQRNTGATTGLFCCQQPLLSLGCAALQLVLHFVPQPAVVCCYANPEHATRKHPRTPSTNICLFRLSPALVSKHHRGWAPLGEVARW